ncbi:MAG: potassium-transporting ATPase subunit C [Bacteroidales bacterium]
MSNWLNIIKVLILFYIIAVIVYIASVDWLYPKQIVSPIYNINNVTIIDYNILNADGDTASLRYFWGVPYSNGNGVIPSHDERLKVFSRYHPYVMYENIPDELIICGEKSDLITPAAAMVQVKRIEKYRENLTAEELNNMIKECCDCQSLGVVGSLGVNLVMLNSQLDREVEDFDSRGLLKIE